MLPCLQFWYEMQCVNGVINTIDNYWTVTLPVLSTYSQVPFKTGSIAEIIGVVIKDAFHFKKQCKLILNSCLEKRHMRLVLQIKTDHLCTLIIGRISAWWRNSCQKLLLDCMNSSPEPFTQHYSTSPKSEHMLFHIIWHLSPICG